MKWRYTDRELCAAERRADLYGIPAADGSVTALMPSGYAFQLPPALAARWRAAPLQEPSLITPADPWSDADQLAAERAGIG
nr:MAG TPA: hypothetical protein [Caudoviricetes sp.]